MSPHPRPFLSFMLLVSIALRVTIGAPCCMSDDLWGDANEALAAATSSAGEHADHGHDAEAHLAASTVQSAHADDGGHSGHNDQGGHGDHGDDPSAKPCCSACGPTLPADPVMIALVRGTNALPQPDAIRALATRPPFPAYDATGPPLQA